MATEQAVRPAATEVDQSLLQVVDEATSCNVAKRILSWNISLILKERMVYPEDAFKSTPMGEGKFVFFVDVLQSE